MSLDLLPSLSQLPCRIGQYTFTQLLGVHEHHEFYRAVQDEVEREVFIELHRSSESQDIAARNPRVPTAPAQAYASFFNSVKARAHANMPRMMQVYESVQTDGYSFVAYQLPQGVALSELSEQHRVLSVLSICRIIEQCATLYLNCARDAIATRVLTSDMIFMESEESFYFLPPLCATCDKHELASSSIVPMQALAAALQPLLPLNVEGSSRTITLVSWLEKGYQGEFLDWQSIKATAVNLIEQVLPNWESNKAASALLNSKAARDRYNQHASKQQLICYAILTLCALTALISLYQIYQQFTPPSSTAVRKPQKQQSPKASHVPQPLSSKTQP